MSHTSMSHVSHINVSSHISLSHVTHTCETKKAWKTKPLGGGHKKSLSPPKSRRGGVGGVRSGTAMGDYEVPRSALPGHACCSVLQFVAACCVVLQCILVCGSASVCPSWSCVLQCVAMCCGVLLFVVVCESVWKCLSLPFLIMHVAVCCNLLQCVAVYCGVL